MDEVTINPYLKLEDKSIYFEAFTPLQLLNKIIYIKDVGYGYLRRQEPLMKNTSFHIRD